MPGHLRGHELHAQMRCVHAVLIVSRVGWRHRCRPCAHCRSWRSSYLSAVNSVTVSCRRALGPSPRKARRIPAPCTAAQRRAQRTRSRSGDRRRPRACQAIYERLGLLRLLAVVGNATFALEAGSLLASRKDHLQGLPAESVPPAGFMHTRGRPLQATSRTRVVVCAAGTCRASRRPSCCRRCSRFMSLRTR